MLRLTTLGAIQLSTDGDGSTRHPLVGQPKRLALLAYLAVARPGSLAFRDTLLALLWPDFDAPHARRALRQTLYHLRRQLGPEVILGGDQGGVGVDPARFRCDAVAFERAVVEDRLEAAVELYRGEFLAGFHPGGGPEYERWLDGVRERLRRKAVSAGMALAERAEAAGDVRRAGEYTRWLTVLLPYDEQAARNLIRFLALHGDRAGAVEVYDTLAAGLRRDLALEPEADTRALIEAVRAGDLGRLLSEGKDLRPAGGRAVAAPRLEGPTLAVLPFAGLSGAASETVLAEGITEMVITELARRASVAIVSRTSVLQYRTGERSLPVIAGELGVECVVEGSVLESRGRLRVTAQLLATSPERHIWAESFDRDVADPLVLQAELARLIADGIERVLAAPAAGAASSSSTAARDAYFRARCQFVRMTPSGFAEAMRHFQDAVQLDPGFAKAHAALAYAVACFARTGRMAPFEAYGSARRRAERALALDPHLAEAHMALGVCATAHDWDWDLAQRHIRRGLELNPELPDSHWVHSNFLCLTGRHAEARAAARKARELDPVVPTLWLNEVLILVGTGDADGAHASAREFAAFHRDFSGSAFALGMVHEARGEHPVAARCFARAEELGGGAHSIAARGDNLARAGRPDEARRLLERLLGAQDHYIPPTSVARIHAALGEADEAFRWLDRAVAVRDDWLPFMDVWPRFEPIRDDPRFAAIRRTVGLPDPVESTA
jgi:DNA-binding SARP family transcriptional activator/TolB-like protein